MNMKHWASALMATGLLLGCSPESPKMLPKIVIPKEEVTEKPTDFTVFNPKVDILFVIDDSGSMSTPQDNLAANAYEFANAISRVSVLDYHIGVVTMDMSSCGIECGRLQGFPNYVERTTPDLVERLRRNMIVGTGGRTGKEIMFDPMLATFSQQNQLGPNKGFYRQDAFLAVIFLTDADDQGAFSPKEAYQKIVSLKGDPNKVLAYGVIRTLATKETCRAAEDVNGKLESFLSMVVNGDQAQSNILSLCATDYGVRLAEFASDIVSRSAGRVKLNRLPVEHTIKVTYGTQVIPNSVTEGWVYERSTNSLFLAAGIEWQDQGPNVGLRVDFEAADID